MDWDLTDAEFLCVASTIEERYILDVAIHVRRPVLAATAVVTGRAKARPLPPGTRSNPGLRGQAPQR